MQNVDETAGKARLQASSGDVVAFEIGPDAKSKRVGATLASMTAACIVLLGLRRCCMLEAGVNSYIMYMGSIILLQKCQTGPARKLSSTVPLFERNLLIAALHVTLFESTQTRQLGLQCVIHVAAGWRRQ